MAGVFDIDLDQPEDAGSEDELEEGVRPGVPGVWAAGWGGSGEVTGPGWRRGPGKPGVPEGVETRGGRERSPGGAEAPRGRVGERAGGRTDLALGVRPLRGAQVQGSP